MKKTVILFLAMLLAGTTASGQDKAQRIKDIREAYAQAKKDMADNGKGGFPPLDIHIALSSGTEVSEDFIINDEREVDIFFKRIHQRPDTDLFDPHCYFIVEKWSANGHTSYREMLFDPFADGLMFSYMKVETHAGAVIESRYYYDGEGRCIEQKPEVGGMAWSSAETDLTKAKAYLAIFDALMLAKGADTATPVMQSTADKARQMQHIRSVYAEAKQKVEKDAKSELPRNVQVTIRDCEDFEMPAQKDVLKFWFDEVTDGDTTLSSCYFMSSTTSLGDHNVYSEYLYEPKASTPVFCFSQQKQNAGPAIEWRYYYDKGGKCIDIKGNADRNGPGFADREKAAGYQKIFRAIIDTLD
ncbi:MAG: hypothetical protein IK075_00265 [Prevotella sp.]|nr:hypothetical protein [Prevotella sp.]